MFRIGTTAVELDSRAATVRAGEAAIGDLIADAMRAVGRADAAVINGGGIRGGKIYAPGTTITRRDILAELPFGNRIVTMEVTGADLQARARERAVAVARRQRPLSAGFRPGHRGRLQPPAGHASCRSRSAALRSTNSRIYRVATNDFMARGGDGYTSFREERALPPDCLCSPTRYRLCQRLARGHVRRPIILK